MFIVVEIIPFLTAKEKLKLLRINNKKKCKSYDGYITVEKQVGWLYDDRI